MYVVRRADDGLAVSTLRVHLAAIRTAHLLAGRPLDLRHPELALVLEGITRSKGVRPRRQAAPAVAGILRRMLATLPASGATAPRATHMARETIMAATAPCCCSASARRCAAPSWSACASAMSSPYPAAACVCGCAAPRPIPPARARRWRSGPIPRIRDSALSPPWKAGCATATPPRTAWLEAMRGAPRRRCSAP
jgi:hypothetical protein